MAQNDEEYTYVGGESITKVSDLPDAKTFLCFTTKSGDHVRLPFTGQQNFTLSKEFLDDLKVEHTPIPGFPGLSTQHKSIWVEVEYKLPQIKEENIVHFDANDSEASWKAVEEIAKKCGWIP